MRVLLATAMLAAPAAADTLAAVQDQIRPG